MYFQIRQRLYILEMQQFYLRMVIIITRFRGITSRHDRALFLLPLALIAVVIVHGFGRFSAFLCIFGAYLMHILNKVILSLSVKSRFFHAFCFCLMIDIISFIVAQINVIFSVLLSMFTSRDEFKQFVIV